MFNFSLYHLFPKFLLQDQNGYAMAKAIEAGLRYFLDKAQEGLDCVQNVDKMPEWRLDEMAWELNSLYDYTATIESKREWIRNAIPLYSIWGTPQSIVDYMAGYFSGADLEEAWQYGGDPYHFRVTVSGEWTPENEAWARKAIATAKNVRSVLDSLRIGSKCEIGITAEGNVLGRFTYPMTGAENWAGRWPQENTLGVIEHARAGLSGEGAGYAFGYPMTSENVKAGTIPQENTLSVIDTSGKAGLRPEAEGHRFPYDMTGTHPDINTQGVRQENDIQAAFAEDTYARIQYTLCGQDEI